ncbi:MAG: hypothetical protein HC910_04895 [Spirulinaceae cyanobacterium SM2_1_0]|nr:hypothetical protein [Spirulinaceae cyanobacterium SM2_1_0]
MEPGIGPGADQHITLPWLHWWETGGNLLLSGEERAEQAQAEAEQERDRAAQLAAKLRELGVDPKAVN